MRLLTVRNAYNFLIFFLMLSSRAVLAATILFVLMLIVPGHLILADEYLQLVTTIPIELDSTRISSITPIGDFNADGYGDLAVGLTSRGYSTVFEAVYLYYGGPAFDSIPDLRLFGDPQDRYICDQPYGWKTGFGEVVTPLGDFNGDGYDDFAISAFGLCSFTIHNGRIYIYFGGPDPDTLPDLEIEGIRDYDGMGSLLTSGDFNGDGLGDLLAHAGDVYYGERMCIFLGSNPPDSTLDWVYRYPRGGMRISNLSAGFNPNNDGFDDFCWRGSSRDSSLFFFLGGDTLAYVPALISGLLYFFFDFDLSGDSIDDVWLWTSEGAYLCLGGSDLDFEPDYYLGRLGSPFIYHRTGDDPVLVTETNVRSFVMYNVGVPFDTVPIGYLSFNFARFPNDPNIEDINADGSDELALGNNQGDPVPFINIYNIAMTGVEDNNGGGNVPQQASLMAYPNPFNSSTTLTYTVANPGPIPAQMNIDIYDIQGRKVRMLLDGKMDVGRHSITWDGKDDTGHELSSGVYFARITQWGVEYMSRSQKLVLAK